MDRVDSSLKRLDKLEKDMKEFSSFEYAKCIKVNSKTLELLKLKINSIKSLDYIFLKFNIGSVEIILDDTIPDKMGKTIYNTGKEEMIQIFR